MEELVGDGRLNWGRVVSLFTFTGVLARQLQEQRLGLDPRQGQELGQEPGNCRELAETIADYLGEEKKDWLLENDGWVSCNNMSALKLIDYTTDTTELMESTQTL